MVLGSIKWIKLHFILQIILYSIYIQLNIIMIIINQKSKILILLFITLTFAILPTYAAVSPGDSNIYGVNKTSTTPAIEVSNAPSKYTITPSTKPNDASVLRYTTLNKYTKNYYTIITIMKKFEKSGGGTLILKRGTYTITNTIPIPSNVNLILEDGVIIKKGTHTGTSKFSASSTLFQLVKPSKIKTVRAYSKYNGVKNVNIIGLGNSIIDLRYLYNDVALVCGHNKNIQIQGITFKNMYSGHFIELDATNGMKISNCKFLNAKDSSGLYKEAINIDTPDGNTKGFNNIWATNDKTPDYNIVIENNVFNNLERAIGTHKYSQYTTNGKYVTRHGQIYHTWIIIRNNYITNIRSDAIRVLNWKDSQITNNYISTITRNSQNYRGILASGAINLMIKNNYFQDMNRPIEIKAYKNTGAGSMYSVTYNSITDINFFDMTYNLCNQVTETFARYSNILHVYTNERLIPLLT